MRCLITAAFLVTVVFARGQDSARVHVLLEAGLGLTWFNASGDDYEYFDTYWQEGLAYSGGVVLRIPASRTLALRIGVRAFSRSFGSVTFDYRTPINSQQSGFTPYEQSTRTAFIGFPIGLECRPIRWVSLTAGFQPLSMLDQTSNPGGDNHSAPVEVAGLEWFGQLDLWPARRVGLTLRYLHQTSPMRHQQRWTPEQVYERTTHWRTMEAGLVYVLEPHPRTNR